MARALLSIAFMKPGQLLSFPTRPSASDSLDACLRAAIAERRLIQFDYEGSTRIAEPHDYGLRESLPRALVYQRSKAGRASRRIIGWRDLFLSKMSDCEVLAEAFPGSRGDAHKHHYKWDVLYARVE